MNPLRRLTGNRSFLKSGKGAVALFGGLLVIPLIGTGLLTFEAINHYQLSLRLDRANAVSAVLGAKRDYSGIFDGSLSRASRNAYLADQRSLLHLNARAVLPGPADLANVTQTVLIGPRNDFWLQAEATYQYEDVYKNLLDAAITSEPSTADIRKGSTFRVERRRIPTEYVLVLDASGSMEYRIDKIREGLSKFAAAAFGQDGEDEDNDSNISVSIVEYSQNVNVGSRYADDLITRKSRKVPSRRSNRRIGYLVSKQFGYRDYLSSKGPEASRGGACVSRKFKRNNRRLVPLESGDRISSEYAARLEDPPKSESEKYDLLIAEARGYYGGPSNQVVGSCCAACNLHPGERGVMELTSLEPAVINWGRMDRSKYTIQSLNWNNRLKCVRDSPLSASLLRTDVWEKWFVQQAEVSVSAWPGCGQPMLVASNSKSEIDDYISGYNAVWTTGADEGFAWGYRALHPNWRNVWHSADDRDIPEGVPADFGTSVKKKFFFFTDGDSNVGHFKTSANVSRFCRYMNGLDSASPRQPGEIEISVAVLGADADSRVRNLYRNDCSDSPKSRHYLETNSPDQVADFLESYGQPEYEVRLVARQE